MKIITIEPTPSPNSMKIVVDTELPFGKSYNFTKDNKNEATGEAAAILAIEGVKGVYHVADFFAVERNAKYAWEGILASIRQVLGEDSVQEENEIHAANEFYGEVYVHVQFYKQVPLQVQKGCCQKMTHLDEALLKLVRDGELLLLLLFAVGPVGYPFRLQGVPSGLDGR